VNNRDKLIDRMTGNDIDRRELAGMLCVDRETVDRWLLPREAARWLEVPDMAVELLKYKLAERQGRDGATGV
jgi:transposase